VTPGKTCQGRGRGERQRSRLIEVDACLWTRVCAVVAFNELVKEGVQLLFRPTSLLDNLASIHHDGQEVQSRLRLKRV
jgi:hypothetical protein